MEGSPSWDERELLDGSERTGGGCQDEIPGHRTRAIAPMRD